MKKVKMVPPALTVLVRANPEKHVLVGGKENDAQGVHYAPLVNAKLNSAYAFSEDLAARDIDDEFIIVPVGTVSGAMEDSLCRLNDIGRIIWELFDSRRTLKDIANELSVQFEAPLSEIEKDVQEFANELLKRQMLIESV